MMIDDRDKRFGRSFIETRTPQHAAEWTETMARSNNTTNTADKASIVARLYRDLNAADTTGAKKMIRRKLRAQGVYLSRMTDKQRESLANAKARKVKARDAHGAKAVAEVITATGDNAGA
jgi:hypothetical protein